jgi:tetratricopeptide (TPR) repeat protein
MDDANPNATDDARSASLHDVARWISGARVAFIGRLGGVTRREAAQLVRKIGGVPAEKADATTNIVVLGAEEPAGAEEHLLDEATRAALAAGQIQLVSETELWARLGLVEADRDVRQLYTPALLAELIGVPVSVIRRWHRRGFIQPVREVHRLPYFDFAEVAVARRLAELTTAGATTAEIAKTIAELQRRAPHSARPLAELPTVVEGKQLLLWEDDALVEPSGQKRFDFDEADDSPESAAGESHATIALVPQREGEAAPLTAEQLLAMAVELEEDDQPAAAIEMYRAALAASGPRAETCFLLAELLYRQGELSAARERYYMAIELDEDFVEARANLACVLAELGQAELAFAALEGALKYHPDYADAHYHLARLLEESNRSSEALAHWQRFLELAPDSPWGEEARERVEG